MSSKQDEEREIVTRFFEAVGYIAYYELKSSDRPDVLVVVNSRRIGIEVTQFHADEATGVRGSALRAEEEKKAKEAKGGPYLLWGISNPLPALTKRIMEKIQVAASYDNTRYEELWLLIAAQMPKPGALGATFTFDPFVNTEELNRCSHDALNSSAFEAAYVHLTFDGSLYRWSRQSMWASQTPH